ncbi:signal peptidase I [Nocardioides currus]|uniref:Signal peptidase I n=1 Tax=Nocardioides currus TaxID=2133958 RepID=A0A2R7YWE1_9ACTN|nr:signal peptidase I [Nocardioides currus]PUA80720.1 signal peptidase I [Nocardioides currus]
MVPRGPDAVRPVHASDNHGTEPARRQLPLWQETILLLAVALVLAVAIKALFLQAFYIPSESMEPGLVKDDRILVQKVSYWGGGEPQRGDVVVFKDPGDWLSPAESAGPTGLLPRVMTKIGLYPSGGHLVKRVIGVAGDVIECCDDQGRILVNGQPLDEDSYVKDDPDTQCNGPMVDQCTTDWKAGPVPAGHVFVMGDNRNHSADSSYHLCKPRARGCEPGDEFVDDDLVVGRVFVLLWPSSRFDWLTRPETFADVPDA